MKKQTLFAIVCGIMFGNLTNAIGLSILYPGFWIIVLLGSVLMNIIYFKCKNQNSCNNCKDFYVYYIINNLKPKSCKQK